MQLKLKIVDFQQIKSNQNANFFMKMNQNKKDLQNIVQQTQPIFFSNDSNFKQIDLTLKHIKE